MKYYTGIGSRSTPKEILAIMFDLAAMLANKNFTVRSGGAEGADTAFEQGCDSVRGSKEIYLPWKNFNKNTSPLYSPTDSDLTTIIASEIIGPAWKYLKRPAQLLMCRNVQQVFGKKVDKPTKFIVCWTPDGCESEEQYTKQTGGTGLAITAASRFGIPVFNFGGADVIHTLERIIKVAEGMDNESR